MAMRPDLEDSKDENLTLWSSKVASISTRTSARMAGPGTPSIESSRVLRLEALLLPDNFIHDPKQTPRPFSRAKNRTVLIIASAFG